MKDLCCKSVVFISWLDHHYHDPSARRPIDSISDRSVVGTDDMYRMHIDRNQIRYRLSTLMSLCRYPDFIPSPCHLPSRHPSLFANPLLTLIIHYHGQFYTQRISGYPRRKPSGRSKGQDHMIVPSRLTRSIRSRSSSF